MPCRECGESAKKHGGACFRLRHDDDGTAHYECLDCVIEAMNDETPNND